MPACAHGRTFDVDTQGSGGRPGALDGAARTDGMGVTDGAAESGTGRAASGGGDGLREGPGRLMAQWARGSASGSTRKRAL